MVVMVGLWLAAPWPAQEASRVQLVPLGQVDGPLLRQMAGTTCGPYLTVTITDAGGGGLLHLAVSQDAIVKVITVPLGAVRVRPCETCQPPQVQVSGDDSSLQVELGMSNGDWKLSPCLRNAKRAK